MSIKISMQDIIDLLVTNNEISKEEADNFVVELFSLIEKGLSTDELAKVKDFGTFKLTHIQERESVDVNTQDKIVIPAHRRVSFLPAQTLKNLVNKPFSHFETTPLNDGIFIDGIHQDALSEKDDDGNDEEDETIEDELTNKKAIDIQLPLVSIPEITVSNKEDGEVEEQKKPSPIVADVLSTDNDKEEQKELSVQPPSYTPTIEKRIEEPTETIVNSTEEEEKEPAKVKPAVSISKTLKSKKPKSRGKLRRYILRWDIAIALFMIFGVAIAYNYCIGPNKPCEKGVEESEIPKPIIDVVPVLSENTSIEPAVSVDSIETKNSAVPVKIVKMSPGRTLRLIALEELGNREFWVYIYLKNKDKIKNPDVVPIGLELELPNESEYKMDVNNSDQVLKAKKLGEQVMKSFW